MAVEPRRGCGYRKAGGLYLVSSGLGEPCHRLPLPLDVCPTCGGGIHQTRGWTWIQPVALLGASCGRFEDRNNTPEHCQRCAVCWPEWMGPRAGLLWVGAQFYKSPHDFEREAAALGVSRRIGAVPRGFELGATWVLLGHPFACPPRDVVMEHQPSLGSLAQPWTPGIFRAFKPERIEKVLRESDATPEALAELARRGITPVTVPDNDPDHLGTVYDTEEAAT